MPNKAIDALAFCPFYVTEARTTITCEGIIGESTLNKFYSEADTEYHEDNFCKSKTCVGCGVYSALIQNYVPSRRRREIGIRH